IRVEYLNRKRSGFGNRHSRIILEKVRIVPTKTNNPYFNRETAIPSPSQLSPALCLRNKQKDFCSDNEVLASNNTELKNYRVLIQKE
ncbi:hypothetical protein V2J09_014707, partial [Rumex salicifolius]